jgi:hypothetical protein
VTNLMSFVACIFIKRSLVGKQMLALLKRQNFALILEQTFNAG